MVTLSWRRKETIMIVIHKFRVECLTGDESSRKKSWRFSKISRFASKKRGTWERDCTFHRTMLLKAKFCLSITVLLKVKDILIVYFITSRQITFLLTCTTSLIDVMISWRDWRMRNGTVMRGRFIFGGNSGLWNNVNAAAKIKRNWGYKYWCWPLKPWITF